MDACSGVITNDVLFLCAIASFATAVAVGIGYMVGNLISNPKVTLWAKTEIIQLFFTIAAVVVIIQLISVFCSIDISALSGMTGVSTDNTLPHSNLFDSAEEYLSKTAEYTHTVLRIERYHLKAFDMLQGRSRWECADKIFGVQLCLFGGSGPSFAPYAWTSYYAGAFHVAFQSALFSFLFTMNSWFILQYVNKGFVLFFLPLGILLRSLPFMRSVGALFITVALCFMIVYPTVLSLFYLVSDVFIGDYLWFSTDDSCSDTEDCQDSSINTNTKGCYSGECVINSNEAHLETLIDDPFIAMVEPEFYDMGEDSYIGDFIFENKRDLKAALQLSAKGFLAGTFLPTFALLATIASISLVARELGEEIDLSRITQMV